MTEKKLYEKALKARELAYCPYSKFATGAALLGKSGKVYLGCNVENASFGPTNCAERTAFFKAVSEGEREFEAIAVCGAVQGQVPDKACPPCGVCRQVMMEFCDPETFEILLVKAEGDYQLLKLKDLLPFGFGPENLR